LNGRELNLKEPHQIKNAIEGGLFDGVQGLNPKEIMIAAKNLSLKRAAAVRTSIYKKAEEMGIYLDKSQIQPIGVGIINPIIPKPSNVSEAAVNRRVEFKLVKVSAESISSDDFDF
jgi:hypothetical protein